MKKNIPWDLLIAHLKEESTAQQEEELAVWYESADNQMLFDEIKLLWDEIVRNSESYTPDMDYYWKLLQTRTELIDKKKAKVTLSLKKLRLYAAAASVLLIMAVSFSFFLGRDLSSDDLTIQSYKALSGKSEILLPDGSKVWLNKGSEITFASDFLRERQVGLTGEALFEVKKEGRKPFIVSTDEIQVKVEGTRFNVQAYQGDKDIRVALLEGKVTVLSENELFKLSPGEIASFDRTSQLLSLGNGDVGFEAFWAEKSYTFDKKTLREICRYLERWYNIQIDLDPVIADSQVYSFTITDEPLEIMLQIMSRINPIRYSFDDEKSVSIKSVQLLK